MSLAGGDFPLLWPLLTHSECSPRSPSGPGALLGTQDPVVANSQPIISKMITATDKCCDGNEAGG